MINDVWASNDGINWDELDNAPWQGRSGRTTEFFNSRVYVIGGVDENDDVRDNHVWSYGFTP